MDHRRRPDPPRPRARRLRGDLRRHGHHAEQPGGAERALAHLGRAEAPRAAHVRRPRRPGVRARQQRPGGARARPRSPRSRCACIRSYPREDHLQRVVLPGRGGHAAVRGHAGLARPAAAAGGDHGDQRLHRLPPSTRPCQHRRVTAPLHGYDTRMADGLDEAREWLETMLLIRRFEERAGQMYAKNKVGGFLHLAIGEEATIVGAVRAMRDEDYLISTYRSHGHALARGTDPKKVMAELFGKATGVSGGRGGSMHMFDGERRFMGGYGIVGGNLPLAAGIALSQRLPRDRGGHGLRVRRRRRQPGHVRRDAQPRRAVEAAGGLHGHQQPVRDGHGARAPHRADRPAQARRGLRRARPALRRDGRRRHLRGHERGDRDGPRRAHADPRGGRHLPLPRPLDGRPRGVPHQGSGQGVARSTTRSRTSRPSSTTSTSTRSTRRSRSASTRPSSSPRSPTSRRPSRSTTTSTCSATR